MEFEAANRCTTSIGFRDPRVEDGELIWSERMPREIVEQDKNAMTDYAVAAQFQQRPAPRGGGMFKAEDFNYLDELPDNIADTTRGWDLAGSDTKRAAYNAGVRMHRTIDNKIIII